MKFKVIIEGGFLHGLNKFEKDNTHDSDNYDDITDEDVNRFHESGWVSLPGEDDQATQAEAVTLEVDNSSQSAITSEA